MRTALRAAGAGCLLLIAAGCRSGSLGQPLPATPQTAPHAELCADEPGQSPCAAASLQTSADPPAPAFEEIRSASFTQPATDEGPLPTPSINEAEVLQQEPLVARVLELNPDIRSASAAWRAAAQRYPQEVSLDDPMFGVMLGPASWGSDDVESAYTLEASQKLPWPGKRRLRGSIARAEANAAFYDVGEERLRIAEAIRLAYYQYFLAHRQLAVLDESLELLQSFRDIALRKFESAEVEQQDVLLADVELAELARERLELLRAERVARARINTLLLTRADAPLPPPPSVLDVAAPLPASEELQALALAQRPELAAQAARIRRERYSTALAYKEFYPDMEFVGRYDAFWQEEPLRPMVGMNINVPVYKQKRWAAVREANARTAQQQALLESQINEISFEVEQSYRRVEESEQTLKVYTERILPTARHSVDAARASYIAGRLDFLRLIESQRQLLALQDRYYAAVAQYHASLAELERELGNDE